MGLDICLASRTQASGWAREEAPRSGATRSRQRKQAIAFGHCTYAVSPRTITATPLRAKSYMKVFLSWSGELSHKVAVALRDWLPSVIQSIEPYVSSEDIDKGARWATDISSELESCSFGILCITSENVEAPWMNFEAGALSKSVDKSRVAPFLFDITRSAITTGPLLQFQSTVAERDDVKKLLHSLNAADENHPIDAARLDDIFEVWWPKLEERLTSLKPAAEGGASRSSRRPTASKGDTDALLESMLELLQQQTRVINNPSELLPPGYLSAVLSDFGIGQGVPADHPLLRELQHLTMDIRSLSEASDVAPTLRVQIERLHDIVQVLLRESRVRRRR